MEEAWLREWQYACTEEELYLCLKRSGLRKAGPVRVGIEAAILLALALLSLIGFFARGMASFHDLFIALAALALLIVLLVAPEKRFRYEAAKEAAIEKTQRVYLFEEGLAFGSPEDVLPFSQCRPRIYEDMAVLRFQGGAVLSVPRRVMGEDDWRLFTDSLRPWAEDGR